MPNHYHLLVRAEDDQLSQHMRRFSLAFVKAWNRLREQSGVAFEGNFQAVHVDQTEYLLHLSRYIHRNPVEAQLVSRAEDWEFSSYRDYLQLRRGTLPLTELVLREFSGVAHYRSFVELVMNLASMNHLLIDDEESRPEDEAGF
jgi:hypothetical protein